MRATLADAGVAPEEVDYINAHGTSTPLGDLVEMIAIKTVFGEHARKLAIELDEVDDRAPARRRRRARGRASRRWRSRHQVIPPTINLENPDPECDLDYVPNQARKAELRYALNNSFGFGGTNGACSSSATKPEQVGSHEDRRLRQAGPGHRDAHAHRRERCRHRGGRRQDWIVSPYDEFAIEEALRIKEAKGGEVVLVSVGPERAQPALRTGLAMGADSARPRQGPGVRRRPTRSGRRARSPRRSGRWGPSTWCCAASRAWAATTARSPACWPSCSTCRR